MKRKFKRLAALLLVLALLVPCLPLSGAAARDYTRISGKDRYATSLLAADALKQVMGVEYFDTIILASGTGFADALAGSYLAAMRRAPIILVADSQIGKVRDYIYDNLSKDGIIYLLGGTGAVSAKVEQSLEGYMVKRLSGSNRYATNIAILNEAGIFEGEVVICTGKGFADSLSASAVGRPIVLVGDSLTAQQEELLAQTSGEFVIIGGTGAVSTDVENRLKELGSVTRLSGVNRYQTSKMVAFHFFRWPTQLVLAYAQNFPDGLSGGPLAYALGAPLMLTANGNETDASGYAFHNHISRGYVLGGQGLISDDTADAIFVDGPDCEDFDHDHFCDDCGERLSECADDSRDHLCDYCGAVLSQCADYSRDHICDYCYQRMGDCYSDDGNHFCDICGARIDCVDEDSDGFCDICGLIVPGADCADTNNDHFCDDCGKQISYCSDDDCDHVCDICGITFSLCEDKNGDGICDYCSQTIPNCSDTNNDHRCDDCGELISNCIDENQDHDCDICGIRMSDCADPDYDHFCDHCGQRLSNCVTSDQGPICQALCDYCGAKMAECFDNLDHFCDDCGRRLSDCADNDSDHICEYCGQTLSACLDSDSDCVCDICGQSWGVSDTQYSDPYVFPDTGYITTEEVTIDTGSLVYHIGENIYVPGHLQEISTVLAETAQQVSGLTFAGNGYGSTQYADGKIHVTSTRDYLYTDIDPLSELGSAWAEHRRHVHIAPGDLFLYDNYAIPHELGHVMRFKQSGWYFARPLDEGVAEFTSHQVLQALEETDPTSAYYLGRSCLTTWNMSITDYDALYAQPVEYWLENEFPYSGNPNYCIGFRFMWYLQEVYGNYTQWITDYESAWPYTASGYSWESEYPDMDTVLQSMKQSYGQEVFDNFYPWLRENEATFEPKWDVTYVDATDVDAVNLFPRFWAGSAYTELYRMDYEDLYVNLESVRTYLEDYKGIDASALTLYNPDKLTVNLYHADGSYVTVYGHEEYSLADISYIRLVGEGRLDLLRIYGYDRCKMDWE